MLSPGQDAFTPENLRKVSAVTVAAKFKSSVSRERTLSTECATGESPSARDIDSTGPIFMPRLVI